MRRRLNPGYRDRQVTFDDGTMKRPTEGAEAPALVGGICELTLQASDLAGLERFYRDAFDCTVVSRDKDRIWLACGERTRLGICSPGPKEFGDQGGTHVHFALSAGPRRLDAIVERLTRAGIAFLGPVEHPGGDRSIYVDDPEGNVVEVWDFFDHGDGASQGVDALA
jgi:catechol-2,3-dioxygenase